MNIEKIVIVVKRTQTQVIEYSAEQGFEIPKDPNKFLKLCEDIKADPDADTVEALWKDAGEGAELVKFDIIEG